MTRELFEVHSDDYVTNKLSSGAFVLIQQQRIMALEAELKAKDEQYNELNKAYAEALISCNNKAIEIIEKNEEIATWKTEFKRMQDIAIKKDVALCKAMKEIEELKDDNEE